MGSGLNESYDAAGLLPLVRYVVEHYYPGYDGLWRAGQTADDLIERAAHRFQEYGEVLVVTDDYAERDMVSGFGGSVASCDNFIRMIGGALAELQDKLKQHNRAERNSFNRSRQS